MQKIEFSCSYLYSVIRRNGKRKLFSLSCEIDDFIEDKIEESHHSENFNEYLNSLGIPTFKNYAIDVLGMDYDDFFPDNPDWENAFDNYEQTVREIILNLTKKSLSQKYIGFYKDNLKQEIYNFDNVPILLCDVSKFMRENIVAPYDVFVYFEKI